MFRRYLAHIRALTCPGRRHCAMRSPTPRRSTASTLQATLAYSTLPIFCTTSAIFRASALR